MPPRASRSISPQNQRGSLPGGCNSSATQHGGGHDHSRGGQQHCSGRAGKGGDEEASVSLLEKGVGTADKHHGCGDSSKGGQRRSEASEARRKLLLATFFCLAVMVCELVGGALSNSLAIMTDAAHMLTDVASFLVSLFSLWLANHPPSAKHSYGMKRAEVLGAVFSVMLIWILTGVLVFEASLRAMAIANGNLDSRDAVDGKLMTCVAAFGLLCNLAIMKILGHDHGHHGQHQHGGHDHSHSHAHDHGTTKRDYGSTDDHHEHGAHSTAGEIENINVRAAYIHALGDVIQSVGVLVSGIVIWQYPQEDFPMMQLADPIATLLFSCLVLATTHTIVMSSLHVLMEGVPSHVNWDELYEGLSKSDFVVSAHDLHVWSLTLGETALSVHLVVADYTKQEKALMAAQKFLKSKNIDHSTIQIEVLFGSNRVCEDPHQRM